MDDAMLEQRLENLNRGLARVEQVLPTLATKDEIQNLDRRLARVEQILPALATKEELRAEHDRLRLDMRILLEHQDSKLQVIAEHVLSLMPKTGSKDAS